MKDKKTREMDPFNWDRISISKYYDIKDILDEEGDDDITKSVRLIAVILDKDETEVWDMDLTEVGKYTNRLKFLEKFDLPRAPKKVVLPGYTLVVMDDVTKLNVAQYVDYQNFITLPFRDAIDKLLSVFLIPEGHKYNTDYDILDVQRDIREHLSFRMAEAFLSFFLRRYGESLIRSLDCYRRILKKEKDPMMKEKMMKKKEELTAAIRSLILSSGSPS